MEFYEKMKTNVQIYLGSENLCSSLLQNQQKVKEYCGSVRLDSIVKGLGEICISTDLIATHYNNFSKEVSLKTGNGKNYNDRFVNEIVEYTFILIKGHIPDQYNPNFLQNISLY